MGSGKHKYDVDPIGILNTLIHPPAHLNFYSEEKRQQFIRQTRESLIIAMSMTDGSKLDRLLSEGATWTLRPKKTDTTYQHWLGLFLSISKPIFIPLILDYSWKKAEHENWFLNHIENKALTSIISNSFLNTEKIQIQITDWLRENKKHIRDFENAPTVKIDEEVINEIYQTLKIHIESPDDQSRFLKLLNEGKIEEPVPFKCNCNFIVLAFDKIRDQLKMSISKKQLQIWLANNFSFYKPKEKRYRKNSADYLAKILYGQKEFSVELKQSIKKIFNFQ